PNYQMSREPQIEEKSVTSDNGHAATVERLFALKSSWDHLRAQLDRAHDEVSRLAGKEAEARALFERACAEAFAGGGVAAVVASPPFQESIARDTVDKERRVAIARSRGCSAADVRPGDPELAGYRQDAYGSTPGQLGALPPGQPPADHGPLFA